MDPIELAWAAGFFDGEGTITIVSRNPLSTAGERRRGDYYVGVNQATTSMLDEGVPPVLIRFQAAVGMGVIGGPYRQDAGRRPLFKWYVRNALAEEALAMLWPYLSQTKRDQAERVHMQLRGVALAS